MPPKSDIWKHFCKITNNLASCNLCKKNFKTSGNTSNLIGHIKAKHRDIYVKHFVASRTESTTPRTAGATSSMTAGSEEMPSTSRTSKSKSSQQTTELTGNNTL